MSLTEKVLVSGLIDRHTAELLERWGYLPEGSSEKVNEGALADATRSQLRKLADDLEESLDKELRIRETRLDLDKLRWPTEVDIYNRDFNAYVSLKVPAVMDRQGRYYFRIQDVSESWFVVGYHFKRMQRKKEDLSGLLHCVKEEILEVQVLYSGDHPVCVQVTTWLE